jgi:hypothetical protein
MTVRQDLMKKWAPILEHTGAPAFKDNYRKEVTAILLENQEKAMSEERQALWETPAANYGGDSISTGSASGATGAVAGFDPILISLVRRAAPQMIAYDICGVQPMTQPTGLIFAMKSRYSTQGGTEALFNEANSAFAGASSPAQSGTPMSSPVAGQGMTTLAGEDKDFAQMAFSIEKTSVTAKTRALKAEYTIELAQDLKSVHGLDAEGELTNILSTEILAEINREVIRTIYRVAKTGAVTGTTATAGTFDLDVDANGRWSVEKFKGLLFQIEREANVIAQQTRRGKGNFILCSSDVASALAMAGVLDYTPALSTNLNVDESSTTFAGVLNGRYKVYVDPYSGNGGTNQFFMVGYKGSSPFDAGVFYCPYVPLQLVRAIDPTTFQPKIGFKTRYGMVSNPFVELDGASPGSDLTTGENYYFRKVAVSNLM